MPLNLPSKKELVQKSKTDVQRSTSGNPFLRNSYLGALVTATANRVFDFFLQLKILEEFIDWSRAGEGILTIVASWFGITRNPATQSTGTFVVEGTLGTPIPSGESVTSGGAEYLSTAASSILAGTVSIASLTSSNGLATAVTAAPHGLASNVTVDVSGANEAGYNLTELIQVVDDETFTYAVEIGIPATATGTPIGDFEVARVPVQSVDFQSDELNVNQVSGSPVTFAQAIGGVNNTGYVDADEIGGGTPIEPIEDFRVRFLDRVQNPVAHFNDSDIIQQARKIPGNTRIFVEPAGTEIDSFSISDVTKITSVGRNLARVTTVDPHGLEDGFRISVSGAIEGAYNVTKSMILVEDSSNFVYFITGDPSTPATGTILGTAIVSLGQVRIFFTRDNDDPIIPSGSEVTTTKEKILEIKPATTADEDVIVAAPIPVPVDFTFTALSPSSSTMQTSIQNKLEQFFKQSTIVGQTLEEDDYRTAINTTIDEKTGEPIRSFTLSTPTGDVTIGSGQLATLGNVTFNV